MKDEADSHDLALVLNKFGVSSDSGLTRWAPLVIVLAVVGGFVTLSWYAYHAGIQSVKEEDLVVVEADKTPIKEKPADPGGMQFPNQDKTVFETFSGNSKQPAKVERVLPTPEEPMPKDAESSDTTTWVNHDVPKRGGPEQVIGQNNPKKTDDKTVYVSQIQSNNMATDRQGIGSQSSSEDEQSETYVASPKNINKQPFAPEKAAAIARSVKEDDASDDEKPEDKPIKQIATTKIKSTPPTPSSSGNAMVQLGAYRSQDEADEAWDKMHLKQKLLSDKKPLVVKADLGEKGVYYRLRIGLASETEAKSLCHVLSINGQACIIPVGK